MYLVAIFVGKHYTKIIFDGFIVCVYCLLHNL